jgi:hypothetical protein
MTLHHDLISGFVNEKREVSGERNTLRGCNQNGKWICSHESEDGRAIFLAIEFRYVHLRLSRLSRFATDAGEGARAIRSGLLRHGNSLAVDCFEDRISAALEQDFADGLS